MVDKWKLKVLHGRLTRERTRQVEIMADNEVLPALGAMSHLAVLDGTIAAVEAVLENGQTAETKEPAQSAA